MSVEFSNTYQDILLDNLVAIIKQNFIFQTQVKLAESVGQKKTELEELVNKLQKENESLKNNLQQFDSYKNKAEQNSSAHEEKSRIQSALNDEMKKSSMYKNQLDEKNKEVAEFTNKVNELKNTIESLREHIPVSKLKKIDAVKASTPVKKEDSKIEKFIKPTNIQPVKIETGGTF